ncbi:MAG: acetyl-CoA C-acyltransferase [Microbacterium sp.]|jgi:acetyl-CoA C-acetyltransferase|uniref:acetyl-CoA C-acyltransferase n=1 Tax=Microbacterium sp. TaxID=51671 RepID=UPI0026195977|nr:acetyl-CoA C-acyltransferase [Microbacterium sp.]MDF2562289.1 acetyl-CoA C-acyltransferase [Microbacterium sp.]
MSVLLAGYARTPFAKFNGTLSAMPATALGAHAVRAALGRAQIGAEKVDAVYAGQVLQAAAGQNPARQTAAEADIPLGVPALTINAVCLSGLLAISEGTRLIESGEADVVVAVGQESMSRAPHVWSGSREGRRYGAVELVDTLEFDGLTDAFQKRSMGASTQDFADAAFMSREEQDEWAARSHRLLAESVGELAGEIEPLVVRARRGDNIVDSDDGLRADTTVASLSRLSPAFSVTGTITAGNSSQITDGAAAVVLVHEDFSLQQPPLARVLSHSFVAGPDVSLLAQPARAILAALAKIGRDPSDLIAVEINEAFAAVVVESTRLLGVDAEIINPTGGAIALGHPIGASGARIVGTLARRLQSHGAGALGAAGICGGGGQGAAVVVESL